MICAPSADLYEGLDPDFAFIVLYCVFCCLAIFAMLNGDYYTAAMAVTLILVGFASLAISQHSLQSLIVGTCLVSIIWSAFYGFDFNVIGYIAAIAMLLALRYRFTGWISIVLISLISLVAVDCSGAALVLAVGLLPFWWRRWGMVLFIVTLIVAIIYVNGWRSVQVRIITYAEAMQSVRLLRSSIPNYTYPATWHAHNLIVQGFVGIGVIPTVLVLVIATPLLLGLSSISAPVIIVSSLVDYIHWVPGLPFLFVMLYMYEVKRQYEKPCATIYNRWVAVSSYMS